MHEQARTPHPDDVIVGRNIIRLRKMRQLSQTELGKALGITFQQVQKYERGTNRTSASKLVMICRALSCRLEDLFTGTSLHGDAATQIAPQVSTRGFFAGLAFDKLDNDQQRAVMATIKAMKPAPTATRNSNYPIFIGCEAAGEFGMATTTDLGFDAGADAGLISKAAP
jgi:transcriptional regulator with XRE-family HTH domain